MRTFSREKTHLELSLVNIVTFSELKCYVFVSVPQKHFCSFQCRTSSNSLRKKPTTLFLTKSLENDWPRPGKQLLSDNNVVRNRGGEIGSPVPNAQYQGERLSPHPPHTSQAPCYLNGHSWLRSSCHTHAQVQGPSLARALAGSWMNSCHRSPPHRPGSGASCHYL